MAYAIIDMGGKQYRVEEGDSVLVDRLGEDVGAKVAPRALLYADGKTAVIEGADLGKVKVEAVVAEHVRGPKLRVNTYRAKKRHRRRMGHRSDLSRLEIRKISGPAGGAKKEPAKKEPAKKAPAKKEPAEKATKED
jgi:large subunit ribosomal protein L21